MLCNCPQKLQSFFQKLFWQYQIPKKYRGYVKATVMAILFNLTISTKSIGSSSIDFQRNKSSVSRVFRDQFFFTDELAWQSALLSIRETYSCLTPDQQITPCILIFDTTHRSRFEIGRAHV